MRMPRKLKKDWVKALRSGEYGQIDSVLCDGKGNFCCLGVLEHIVMDGECEIDSDGRYLGVPSQAFYDYAGIETSRDKMIGGRDKDEEHLMEMNDSMTDAAPGHGYAHESDFNVIADWIEKKVKTF